MLIDGGGEPFEELCAQAAAELARVVDLINNLEPAGSASPGGQSGSLPADFEEQLQGLLGLLEEYDSSAEDRFFEILEQVKGADIEDTLKGLKRPIGQYDLEAAAEALKPIIEHVRFQAKDDD